MIPKEFKKTTAHKKEYDDFMAQFDFEDTPDDLKHSPPIEEQLKEHKASPEFILKELAKKSFTSEYEKFSEAKSFFLGCTYDAYTSNYEKRLQDFKNTFIDAEEHNFIVDELNLISSYQFSDLINENLKKNIKYSLEKTGYYLKEKLKSLGYIIEDRITDNGNVNSIAIKDASVIKLNNEPTIDLSDSISIDKIRYLGLVGFFDYIKDREPHLSINQVASLISGITGVFQQTIQPYINPILSSEVSQEKNPFLNKKKVAEITKQLINIGVINIKNI
jgi:hypothetical protein